MCTVAQGVAADDLDLDTRAALDVAPKSPAPAVCQPGQEAAAEAEEPAASTPAPKAPEEAEVPQTEELGAPAAAASPFQCGAESDMTVEDLLAEAGEGGVTLGG